MRLFDRYANRFTRQELEKRIQETLTAYQNMPGVSIQDPNIDACLNRLRSAVDPSVKTGRKELERAAEWDVQKIEQIMELLRNGSGRRLSTAEATAPKTTSEAIIKQLLAAGVTAMADPRNSLRAAKELHRIFTGLYEASWSNLSNLQEIMSTLEEQYGISRPVIFNRFQTMTRTPEVNAQASFELAVESLKAGSYGPDRVELARTLSKQQALMFISEFIPSRHSALVFSQVGRGLFKIPVVALKDYKFTDAVSLDGLTQADTETLIELYTEGVYTSLTAAKTAVCAL